MSLKILKIFLGLLTLSFFFIPTTNQIFAKEWNGIVPIKSTRTDVEKKLGKPRKQGGYLLKDRFVNIFYSECKDSINCECLVDRDTVIRIEVTLHFDLNLTELKLDLDKFEKKLSEHLLVYETYSNFKEGVVYTVLTEDNLVTEITYLASEEDCQKLTKKGQK